MRRSRTRAIPTVVLVAALLLGAGCGDDSLADDASSAIDKSVARVQAEAFRLQVMNLASNEKSRFASASVLTDAAKDLPGTANIAGIADADGDGNDDDGKVEITVDSEKACVTVASGDIDVSSGPC